MTVATDYQEVRTMTNDQIQLELDDFTYLKDELAALLKKMKATVHQLGVAETFGHDDRIDDATGELCAQVGQLASLLDDVS